MRASARTWTTGSAAGVGRRAAGGGRRARAAGSLTRRRRGGRRVRTAVPRSAAAPARREHRAGREEDEEQQAPHRPSMARRAAPCARTCYQPAMPQPGLAVQLYTLRDRLAEDLDGTLAALAGTGARDVELAGLYGRSAAEHARRASSRRADGVLRARAARRASRRSRAPCSRRRDVLGTGTLVVPCVPAPADAAAADIARRAGDGRRRHRRAAPGCASPTTTTTSSSARWTTAATCGAASSRPAVAHEPDVGWLRVAGRDPVAMLGGLGPALPARARQGRAAGRGRLGTTCPRRRRARLAARSSRPRATAGTELAGDRARQPVRRTRSPTSPARWPRCGPRCA